MVRTESRGDNSDSVRVKEFVELLDRLEEEADQLWDISRFLKGKLLKGRVAISYVDLVEIDKISSELEAFIKSPRSFVHSDFSA